MLSIFSAPIAGSYDPMVASLYMQADENETISYERAEVICDAYDIKQEFNSLYGPASSWDFGVDVGELYDWIVCQVHHKKYGTK